MNKTHRISLKAQWQVDGCEDPTDNRFGIIRASRLFHRPTGISNDQVIRLCFEPVSLDIQFSLNGRQPAWTKIEHLAIADITSMMESINRVELEWRVHSLEAPQLPEHFAVWLEILDDDPIV